jgi:hypothetical protein
MNSDEIVAQVIAAMEEQQVPPASSIGTTFTGGPTSTARGNCWTKLSPPSRRSCWRAPDRDGPDFSVNLCSDPKFPFPNAGIGSIITPSTGGSGRSEEALTKLLLSTLSCLGLRLFCRPVQARRDAGGIPSFRNSKRGSGQADRREQHRPRHVTRLPQSFFRVVPSYFRAAVCVFEEPLSAREG